MSFEERLRTNMTLYRKAIFYGCCALMFCSLFGFPVTVSALTLEGQVTNPSFQAPPIAIPDFKYMGPEQTQLAKDMSAVLSSDLEYSGAVRPLDPKGFLEDPQTMGIDASTIKFVSWKKIGADFLARGSYQVQGGTLKMEGRLFDVSSGRLLKGKAYEGDVRNYRSMVHDLADEILLALTGERGVFGTKIAYVQSVGGAKEIFYCDFDGGNPVQVTRDNSLALSPSWSSDGSQIAYVSYKDGSPKVYAYNVRTGAHTLICSSSGMCITPAWRPGRNELAVTMSKEGAQDIYIISSSGQVVQKLGLGFGSSISVSPDWSPDGRKLAYVSNEAGTPQIYIVDVGSGQKKRLTYSGAYNTSPAWSPKGDWITYSGLAGGQHNIFIIRPDGSDNRQLTSGEGSNEGPVFSPDGRMIAFSSTRQGGPAIWVLLANGTGARRLTRQAGSQELPDWSARMNR